MAYKVIFYELLWFLKGEINIKYFVDNNVKIWNEWFYENYKKFLYFKNEFIDEFILKIKEDDLFVK